MLKLEKANAVESSEYEQKLFRLQEEVTELHRQKGSLAEKVIDLNKVLQEKDKVALARAGRISELESNLQELQATSIALAEEVGGQRKLIQMLEEEKRASDATIQSLENKNRGMEQDKYEMLQRISELQGIVERLKNIEHDVQYRRTQETIRKNLEEAANTIVGAEEGELPPECMKSTVPQKIIAKIDASEGEVNSVRFAPSGLLFGSAGFDRKLRLWSVVNGKVELRSTLIGCNAAITAIDFDPNESVVLGASSDFSCRVWTLNDSRLRVNLTGHSEKVSSAKFMGCPNRVVTASSDRTIKLWDVDKCQCKRTIMAVSAPLDVVACGTSSLVVTGHFDHKIRVWDERTGENTWTISLSGRVTGLDIAQDSTHLLACTRHDTLEVISFRKNQVMQCLRADGFHVGLDIVRPCFSPNTMYAVAGGHDGGIYVWDRQTGSLEVCLQGHSNTVVCCHWNPADHSLISCERISKAIVWSD
ncbi:unnamed protein product [Calicophoron daubneyi]